MKMTKISIRDSAQNSDAMDPEEFNSEYLLGPQKVNNISNLVNNLYYLGYKDEKSILEKLKLRGIDADADVKKAVKACIERLEDREEQSPKK
jgi:hypothetical protein